MAEYIEREAATAYAPLPKELREYQTTNLDDAFEYGYDFAIGQIDAIPAADVVEVVRCKDCFNRTKSGMCIQWSRYEKIYNTPDYAFCSWGVKNRDV